MTGLNVTTYGATGDGVTDDTAAIQAALDDAAAPPARRVILPAGTYLLGASLTAAGPVELCGEGQERTVLIPPPSCPALRIGDTTLSGPHGLYLHDFTIRGGSSTGYPMVDIRRYGRKWVVERINLDNGFGDRPGIRAWTSWTGVIRDCNFWKFGVEGQPSHRAAIVVKPQALGGGLGPINNVVIDACAFERVQTGIDLHDPVEAGTTTVVYSVEIRNPRFKNTAADGWMPNSVGIRSNDTATMNVLVTTPFFEDFETGILVRGWGWTITSPFGQSADVVVDLVAGGGHLIDAMVLQTSAGNAVGVGVRAGVGVTRNCEVRRPVAVTGSAYLGALTDDQSGGKLVVTSA